jgi:hypothetical protein
MNPKLTARDIEVILSVYKCRYLTGSQIERLHFSSKRPMWRRIQALLELGFIKSFTAPHIPERIFYLDKKGAEIVAIESRVPFEDLEWYSHTRAPKDYYFLRHFLAINDFRITLTLACQKSTIHLSGFIPEYVGEKTGEGHVKKYIRSKVNDIAFSAVSYSHTPDAVFSLEKDGRAALFFLEIDRGGEVLTDSQKGFLKCVVFYLNLWSGTVWKRYEKDFGREFNAFRVLIVTTSQERLKHMRDAVTAYPFPQNLAKRFLWGTIQSHVTTDWLFESMWQSMDTSDTTLYRIG